MPIRILFYLSQKQYLFEKKTQSSYIFRTLLSINNYFVASFLHISDGNRKGIRCVLHNQSAVNYIKNTFQA